MISQRLLNKILLYFIVFSLIIFTLLLIILVKPFEMENVKYNNNNFEKEPYFDTLVGKSLFLLPTQVDISLPSIKDSFKIAKIADRPDSFNKKVKFEIKFNNSDKIIKVLEDEVIYLEAKNKNFEFSNKKTPLQMYLNAIDNNNIRVILKAELKELDQNTIKQDFFDSFIVSATDSIKIAPGDKFEFKILSLAKWWGEDCFLKIYLKNDSKYQKQRLEIDSKIYYLQKNDVLICKDGKWQLPILDENTQKYPIAIVKSIDSNILEIEAFDETGSDKFIFAISQQPKNQFSQRGDQFITAARKRTHTHISCLVDKQRMILKQGDILIKKEGRWKFLKKSVNFDNLKSDEIFYLEKIENRSRTNYLVGYLFSSMRNNFQKIEVPILSLSNKKHIKRGNY